MKKLFDLIRENDIITEHGVVINGNGKEGDIVIYISKQGYDNFMNEVIKDILKELKDEKNG